MRRYIIKRVLHSLFIIWLVATTVFIGLQLLPGGPVRTMMGPNVPERAIQEMRRELGLHKPIWIQYLDFLKSLITFQFGTSLTTQEPIEKIVMTVAPRTFSIGIVGMIVGITLSIPTGIISALRKGEPSDYVATVAAFAGLSFPAFFIGILLMLVFAVHIDLFPTFGYVPIKKDPIGWAQHIILPGIAVGLPYTAVVMRMTRSSMLEVMGQQYMKTAKSKGVSARVRLWKHALQNALIPVVTVAGIQIALIIIGSVTVEIVFGINGIGRTLVDSILKRDYPLAQVIIIITSTVLVGMNLIVDIVYTVIDPRIRYEGES
ncbi:MAG: ABC transporter permease [Halobacteriales archaeon]